MKLNSEEILKSWQGATVNAAQQPHKQFEARLIQLLRWRFEKSDLGVKDHLKVGDLPLEIDVVVISSKREWRPDFGKFPQLFDYFRRHNVMEVKTEQHRFKVEDLPKLLAYVISFSDLPDELMTEELRAFSDPARRRQTLISCLGDQEKAPIVETIFDLYESEATPVG